MRRAAILALALAAAAAASAAIRTAGLLTGQGAVVLDSTGSPRTTFSNNETIGFQITVFNGAASANRIVFQLGVVAPNGNTVFNQVGNSVPGTVGTASARIAGVPIAGFYQGPGTYTLRAFASLDGSRLEQDQTFTISSPNILLIYPPNGASGLTDNPLTFQWFSSGATSYRVTVGDNPSLYNALFVQTTAGGVSSLTYPQNPPDPRQHLSAGQLYYWKVEGLDNNGNVVAQSQVPFSFSVANVVLTRDLAVTGLDILGAPDAQGNVPFRVTVKDQGSTTESNVALKVTLGGLPAPASPITMPALSPNDVKTFDVSAQMPSDQNQSLAIACLSLFDDNVANNCRTLAINRPAPVLGPGAGPGNVQLSADQIWQAIEQLLKDQGIDLSQFQLMNMEGSLTRDELASLLDQLRSGQAQATLSGPPMAPPVASLPSASTPTAAAPAFEPPPAAPEPVASEPLVLEGEDAQEWSGYSAPIAAKTNGFTITDETRWQKLWSRLSDAPVPKVDFTRHRVVAILAGRGVQVDRIEIDSSREEARGLVVRYRMITYARMGRPNAPALASLGTRFSAYILKVVPRDLSEVLFQEVKENPNE